MKKKEKKSTSIVVNKKARHDYHLTDTFEAGIVLTGWEVKSIRQKKIQLVDSYVLLKSGEAWLIGASITPLDTASTHVIADPRRDRKLLLHKKELSKLFGATQKTGQTCVCTHLFWSRHLVKDSICLAQGKKEYDKRASIKEREWNVEKNRVLKTRNN